MFLRGQRLSDMVACVCVPTTFVLYLHLMVTQNAFEEPQLMEVDYSSASAIRPLEDTSLHSETTAYIPEHLKSPSHIQRLLNVTVGAREEILLVTPILRCGATTTRNILKLLRSQNHFNLIADPPKKAEVVHIPNLTAQRYIAGNISAFKSPSAVMQSFAYINFTQFGYQRPIQIAMVRDPIARAVSWFYHARAPFQIIERHNRFPDTKFPTRKFLKKDIETCLKDRKDIECRYLPGKARYGHTVEFFCGHEENCIIFGDYEGMQRAKKVVETEFAVVGILEDWDKTLAVLEHYIPRFFKGVTQVYKDKLQDNKQLTNMNFYKPKVDPKAIDYLRKNFTVEAEFYDFLRQRLDQQYKAIKLDTI
ncbi:unnamed protein product [Meganyctiphanes norvegica]|uniref:Heparan sulfate 2-O-sulfotransferase pipe n=1 Tax=Meganyctiphanes norvegica TaxID=48144 RepID=A0AAV2PZI4_MEGNR